MNTLGPRWGLFVLLPLTATGLSYAVARATAPGGPADPPPISTTTFASRAGPVTATTVPDPAPPWRALGVADALRAIAAMNCAYGDPTPIPRLGLALHTSITSVPPPSCPGAWRSTTTTVRLRLPRRAPATSTSTTFGPTAGPGSGISPSTSPPTTSPPTTTSPPPTTSTTVRPHATTSTTEDHGKASG